VFTSAGDQVDADRAELDGVAWYTWVESTAARTSRPSTVETGAVRCRRRRLRRRQRPCAAAGGAERRRCCWIYQGSGQLYVVVLDPRTRAPRHRSTRPHVGHRRDREVRRVPGRRADTAMIACKRTTTTSYSIATITAAGLVTTTTVARDCTGAIAVSVEPTGAQVQVIRANGTNVQGDLITIAGFVDVYTRRRSARRRRTRPRSSRRATARCRTAACIAATPFGRRTRPAPAARLVQLEQLGQHRQHARHRGRRLQAPLGASRARVRPQRRDLRVGRVLRRVRVRPVRLADALQSTYFLLRDDGFLAAKAVTNTAGAGAAASRTTATAGSRAARTSAAGVRVRGGLVPRDQPAALDRLRRANASRGRVHVRQRRGTPHGCGSARRSTSRAARACCSTTAPR
jgi:hypothetical protein